MLETKLSYKFNDDSLLTVVVTRIAAIGEGLVPSIKHKITFSRLKFLGTRVLSLLISDLLFATNLFGSECELTTAHSHILSHDGLIIKAAKYIGLDDALIVGKGESLNSIQTNNKVLFAHMQALIGAIWIDCNANYSKTLDILCNAFKFSTIIRTNKELIDIPSNLIPTSKLDYLQAKFGHIFSNKCLLLNALIRQSALEEKLIIAKSSFQTLEFLGDKVLGCIIAEWLMTELVDDDSNVLTPLFSELVSNSQILPKITEFVKLGDALIIGAGEELVGIRSNQRKLADHVEALIAALWLDVAQDYKKTKECIIKLFRAELENLLHKKFDGKKLILSDMGFPSLLGNYNQSISTRISTSLPPEGNIKSFKDILLENSSEVQNKQKLISTTLPFFLAFKGKNESQPLRITTNKPKIPPLDLKNGIQFPSLQSSILKKK